MTEYFIPDGGFERSRKPGRPRKKIRFNPNRKYVAQAVARFLKKGGKITKLDPFSFEQEIYYSKYRSPDAADFNLIF